MAPPQSLKRLSSTSSHHTVQAPRLSLTTTNPNVFSDDNALDSITPTPDSTSSSLPDNHALPVVSNPSEPPAVEVNRRSNGIEGQDQNHKRRSVGDNELSPGTRRERSSAQNPNHNHHQYYHDMHPASSSEMSKGSTSTTSAFAMPPSQSPYQGATGPSHPYGMYPQDIGISRTPSSATIPNARAPERAHLAVGGPTQPYGMYPQNTVPEDDHMIETEVVQPMPGFPGRQRNYQRRFGPDSDEAADIVGPDGYTEQLPAYTRYANDIPPKLTNPTPNPTTETRHGQPENRPGESRDTLNTIISEDSDPRSPVVGDSSTRLSAPLAGGTSNLRSEITALPPEAVPSHSTVVTNSSSEGGHFKELVKERGKKRVCWGKVPMWLCMLGLAVGACIVGGLIGGILGRAKASSEGVGSRMASATFSLPTVTVTATSLVDAVPISSPPAGLPSPIPGSYTLPLMNATYLSNECVHDPLEAHTWDCTGGALMDLNIAVVDSNPAVLFNYSDNDGPLNASYSLVRYGAQPPILDGYTTMSIMNATDHLEKGPAYVFHKQFDKLVILPEGAFDNSNPLRPRQNVVSPQHYNFSEAKYALPGEKPWFCYWNGTLLEGFIFVTQIIATTNTVAKRANVDNPANMDNAADGNPDWAIADSAWDTSSKAVSMFPTPTVTPVTSIVLVNSVSSPSPLTRASAIEVSVTSIPAPPDISVLWPFWSQDSASAATSASLASASMASASEASASKASDNEFSSSTATFVFDPVETIPPDGDDLFSDFIYTYERYPTVVKIEERRDLESQAQPYCQQMLIMENRSVQRIPLGRIDLTVDEFGEIQSRRSKKRSSNMSKREDGYGCECAWILDGP